MVSNAALKLQYYTIYLMFAMAVKCQEPAFIEIN